jgi:CrcB protein
MKAILLVGIGRFIESVLRYLLFGWVPVLDKPWFPAGMFAVSVLGCLVIGLLGGIAEQRPIFAAEFKLYLFIGILGGFTTFSTFSADETLSLVHNGHDAAAFMNIALQVMVALLAVWLVSWRDCLTFDGPDSAQEFLKILELWSSLGRLIYSGEVFHGEKTNEGCDI